MSTGISEVTSHEVIALHEGWLIPIQLIHRPADPFAVTLILEFNGKVTEYTFGLDLLHWGYSTRKALMGPGNVHTRRYQDSVVIVLKGGKGQKVMLLVSAADIAKFLRAVKPEQLDFDKELEELLKGSADE